MKPKALPFASWAGCRRVCGGSNNRVSRAALLPWLCVWVFLLGQGQHDLRAATVPAGFTETVIPGPSAGNWDEAVGLTIENNGRVYVWERSGRIWFKDPTDSGFSLLLDISEEVGDWGDHGCLGFVLDPQFRVNGYVYLLYVVDRYHLLNYGTPGYNPAQNQYNEATIGRLTRYTCTAANGFQSANLASRLVLLGETKQTGIPMCSETHGVGSLVFGEDGTLLISCGDGASPNGADVGGAWTGSFAPQALADGIIRTKEDIGAFRAQLVDCLDGKVLRIDPATGNGVPSNPFYDAANPRAPRSRVWALGLRNPFRMTLRPESGSHNPADGNPGVLYSGNVGWNTWESLKVVTRPAQNLGWPIFEGLDREFYYGPAASAIFNRDAPNPLYPGSGCNPYFSFDDLLKEDTLDPAGQPPFVNPCNSSQRIPTSIPQFLHTRPVLDWNHSATTTRTPIYGSSGQAQTVNVGSPSSPVSGTQFKGNCAIGGTWYTGTNFPAAYQDRYYFADWGSGVIETLTFDANNKPVALGNFATAAGAVVSIVQHPIDHSLYYISYDYNFAAVKKLAYTGNRTPVAVAATDQYYGATPLAVQFSSSGSSDPDGQTITYSWNFGDGSSVSTLANPAHTFSAPVGVPTKFVVTLTVTDSGGLSAQTTLIVAVNDTPPNVTITSPVNGSLYSSSNPTTVNLTATVSDTESADAQLSYAWQTLLHHNDHNHLVGTATNDATTAVLSPTGCDGINIYYYRIVLTVTDPTGLSTTREVRLFPDCGPNTPPIISSIANQTILQDSSTAPISFTVGDAEVAAANLQLSGVSSNPALVPNGNITFGGSGSTRTVTVTPAPNQTGTATITVTVNDGPNNTSTSLLLTVNSSTNVTKSFTNGAAITIRDSGAATPYPSTITVTNLSGTIANLTVTLPSLTHTWKSDVDVLLVGPGGQKLLLMSDAGNTATASGSVTLAFSDSATAYLPAGTALTSGTNKPTNYTDSSPGGDNFPGPAPAGPYGAFLSVFNGLTANGNWSLYVFDDGPGDQGSFAGGWSLTVTTLTITGSAAPTISDIPDQSTTVNTPTPAIPFTMNDADTPVGNLVLSASSSNPTLVPTNNIEFGGSGSSRTVTVSPAANQTGSATITVTISDGTNSASDAFVLTVNAVNTPPMIAGIADQTINEGSSTGPLGFTVGDAETAPGSLTLSKGSSNPTLVPTNNVVFGGTGANRTVTVTPAANQNGSATITVTVSDGTLGVSTNFLVTVTAVDDVPTISSIANQTTAANTPTAAIPFTVGDVETPAASLTVTGVSSNQTLVPNGNIVFGGSGSSRTVTVSPAANQTGSATITVTVSDGTNSASDAFVLTVNAVNTPPMIAGIADQTINEDSSTGPLGFTVGDAETAPDSLTLSKGSSNAGLVPTNNIVFGGSGANRTVTVTPVANQNGTATITVTVSDGQYAASTNFVVTVSAVNDAPTITGIANQTINANTSTGPLSFTIGDVETAAGSLALSGASSNPTLVPANNIVFGGSGTSRTVTVTAATNQTGSATITVGVSDGQITTSTNFVVTVSPLLVGTKSFTNATAITIPGSGAATPYPSTINVTAMDGAVSNVTVTLYGITHGRMRDIDVLLTGPAGQKVIVLSDVGPNGAVNDVTLTLSDAAASSLGGGTIVSGTYKPSNTSGGDTFLSPAPAGPYGATMSAFNGQGANGTWALYVVDDSSGSSGRIAGGWSLSVTTVTTNGSTAPTISNIPDQSTTVNTPTAAVPFTIGDADTSVDNLTLSAGSSNGTLVPTNNIVFGGSGTNRTVTVTPAANQTGIATITVTVSDGTNNASDPFVLTVNAVNTPPTITGIAGQTINEDTSTAALGFTVGDAETVPGSLTLSKGTSNPTLVPTNNIVFGGSGANRTVTVTPAANQNGTATITVTVSDGQYAASTNFVMTVSAVNDAPTISDITNQFTTQNTPTVAIPFTISDVETAATSLTLSKGSSNPTLVPTNNIVFGGSGASRTVTVTPAASQTGTSTITVVVSDGTNNISDTFLLTVGPANTPPTIAAVQAFSGSTVFVDHPALYKFYIRDLETATNNLQLSFASSNPVLFPTTNAVFHWFVYDADGQHWYLTLVPAFGLTGTATNTLTVSDGTNSVSTNLVITVTPPPPGAARFANTSVISIPDAGVATPYPSVINVTGMVGIITNVTLTLSKINHQGIKDVHMLLVGPTGRGMVVFSRISSGPVADTTATLLDAAPDWAPLPPSFDLWSEQFRPADYAPADTNNALANHFPAPAPAGPYAPTPVANAFSNAFNGLPANGAWYLYVYDESGPSHGNIVGGWSLMIATDGAGWPTISNIPDQSTTVNTPTAAVPFTIGDADTPVDNLTLSAGSSNATLVPTNNIVFGGSGTNRTVTVTPAANQTGIATITVTVSDGTNSASDAFVLTVNAVNTPPTITGIADQTINEDTSTAALGFTVGDAETVPGSLTLSKGSSNPTLVPTNNIVFGGSGANRTVTVSPAANQNGTATITVTVSDGQYAASTNFVVTVTAVNDAPTITGIVDQTINLNTSTGPLSFTIGDVETAAGSLTLSGGSSNPTLVPANNIVFGGSGSSRTVTVSPAADQTGSATITVGVSDGQLTTSTSFGVTVSAQFVGTKAFTNSGAIAIPDSGAGTPYPSVINVSGMGGTVSNVTVTLRGLSHTWGDDINALLVSPAGQKVTLMSDAGTGGINNANLGFSDGAAGVLPQTGSLVSGTFKPTDYGPADTYPAPAPAGPYGTNLSAFIGTAPNGTWSLFVYDDGPGDQGNLAGGWSVTVTTLDGAQGSPVMLSGIMAAENPPRISSIALDQGTLRLVVSGPAGFSYALEASSDLTNWTQVAVQENTTGEVVFSEEPTTNALRFYRAASIPK